MKIILFTILLIFSIYSFAEDEPNIRNATQSEFVGYWRVLLLPDEKNLHPKVSNKIMGMTDGCNFNVHKSDGNWYTFKLNRLPGQSDSDFESRCESLTKAEIEKLLPMTDVIANNHQKWLQINTQLYAVDNPKSAERQIWAVEYVIRDTSDYTSKGVNFTNYFEFRKGDLIMDRTMNLGGGMLKAVWRMILRPVSI